MVLYPSCLFVGKVKTYLLRLLRALGDSLAQESSDLSSIKL